MSGSARLRDSPRSGLIAAALCVLATAAVLITAPAVHSALRSGASGRQPLAPRLAALSDQELAQLLPKQSEFPASWTVDETTELSDTFGYFKYHVFDEGLGFDPIVCFGVVGVASTGAFDAAQVFGHDPAAQVAVADGKDILLTVGREFDRSGFDAFVGLVSRCLRFGSAVAGSYTVRILEDSRPTAGPQRFRYSLTTTISAEPADETRTDYYSYGRTSGWFGRQRSPTGSRCPVRHHPAANRRALTGAKRDRSDVGSPQPVRLYARNTPAEVITSPGASSPLSSLWNSRPTLSPAFAVSRFLRKASIASTRTAEPSLIRTSSPTLSSPCSTRPVATSPRLRMKNTSWTVMRNMRGTLLARPAEPPSRRRGGPPPRQSPASR